jgi:hypothetical protein
MSIDWCLLLTWLGLLVFCLFAWFVAGRLLIHFLRDWGMQ